MKSLFTALMRSLAETLGFSATSWPRDSLAALSACSLPYILSSVHIICNGSGPWFFLYSDNFVDRGGWYLCCFFKTFFLNFVCPFVFVCLYINTFVTMFVTSQS
jgi:hypothetical protein